MEDDMDETGALDAAADDMAGASGPLSAFDTSRIQSKLNQYQDVAKQQAAYYDRLEKELLARRTGPSASERLYQLSAAFAKPTRTRGFAGVMNNIMPVLQQQAQATREDAENRAEALSKLQQAQLAAKQGLLGQELTTELKLADLQRKSNAPVRGVAVGDQLKNPYTGEVIGGAPPANATTVVDGVTYLTTPGGRPSTPVPERSKFRAATPEEAAAYGAKSGQINITTGEFKPVTQAPQAPRKLSQTEQRELFETESVIGGGQETLVKLQRLLELNPTSLEGSLTGVRKKVGQLFNSDDPAYLAAEEIDNLTKELALGELKTTFPGAISNDERKVLVELKGSASMPRAVRERIWKKAVPVVQRLLQRNTQRLEKLKSGYYSTQGGTSSPAPSRVIRFDRNGNRI
jgi:hypothetical protein